jgi:hypothetical protein
MVRRNGNSALMEPEMSHEEALEAVRLIKTRAYCVIWATEPYFHVGTQSTADF